MIKFISTRGTGDKLTFEEVLLTGLAPDGGLYVPERLPRFSRKEIASWAWLPYSDLAFRIMRPFAEGCIPDADFKIMVTETYQVFRHEAVAPLRPLNGNEWVLELFHGPTLAFQDFALQLLGRLLEYVLDRRGERALVIAATNGDTGPAAIEGCRRCERVDMLILHPHRKVSAIQRRQMTTVNHPRLINIAIEGDFGDCETLALHLLADTTLLEGVHKVAVNSISWVRIMAQVVCYFYAALQLGAPARAVGFSVPTGNFGDIYAGYVARKMGLPINQLIVATNRNDMLHRFMNSNRYARQSPYDTLACAHDIGLSSNLERLLFDLHSADGTLVSQLMLRLNHHGELSIAKDRWLEARTLFDSLAVDDELTCSTLATVFRQNGEVLDPQSAIGVAAGRACRRSLNLPLVVLGTAHPLKFPKALAIAGIPFTQALPEHLQDLPDRSEHYRVMPNDLQSLQEVLRQQLAGLRWQPGP